MHGAAPGLPIVVLTGLNDEALAIQAVQQGAQDYLVKGQVDGNLLSRAMRYALERKRAEESAQIRHHRGGPSIDLFDVSTESGKIV